MDLSEDGYKRIFEIAFKRHNKRIKNMSSERKEILERLIGITRDLDVYNLKIKREDKMSDIKKIKKYNKRRD